VSVKVEEEENKSYICEDTLFELNKWNAIAGQVAMGEDEGLATQDIKDAHQYLDRFIHEIAYKARFESHFIEFKKDILKHINEMQTGIQELGKNKP